MCMQGAKRTIYMDIKSTMEKENLPLLIGGSARRSAEAREGDAKFSIDKALDVIGSFGPWQISILLLISLGQAGNGFIVLLWSFTGLEPTAFRCHVPGCDQTDVETFFQDPLDPDFCQRPILNRTSQCDLEHISGYRPCDANGQFLYEEFQFKATLVTELNLVCGEQFKVALMGTFYMLGNLAGSVVAGYPMDAFGRKPVYFFGLAAAALGNLVGGFLTEFWGYAFCRFLAAFGFMLTGISGMSIAFEIVGTGHQTVAGSITSVAFAIGEVMTGIMAYFIRDWRLLHHATSVLIIPQILFFLWIPESPRWLLTKKKWDRLKTLLETAAKKNKSSFSEEKLPQKYCHESGTFQVAKREGLPDNSVEDDLQWHSLFTINILYRIIIVMSLNWAMVSTVYYGLGMSFTVIGGNIFANFVFGGLIEILGYTTCLLITDHWGRKTTLLVSFMLCGISCIGSAFLIDGSILKIVLALLGKMTASTAFMVCWVYTSELFPTPIRGSAFSCCSTIARITNLIAPQIALYLPAVTIKELPLIIFGSAALVGAFLTLLLPETLGYPLPDSLFEVRHYGKEETKSLWSWWSKFMLQEKLECKRRRNTVEEDKN